MKVIITILAILTLASCVAKVEPPELPSITIGPDDGGHDGSFCPPGQAKKGVC